MSNSMTAVGKNWIGEKLGFWGRNSKKRIGFVVLSLFELLPTTTLEAARGYGRDAKGRRSRT
jgi:hypothetical protein